MEQGLCFVYNVQIFLVEVPFTRKKKEDTSYNPKRRGKRRRHLSMTSVMDLLQSPGKQDDDEAKGRFEGDRDANEQGTVPLQSPQHGENQPIHRVEKVVHHEKEVDAELIAKQIVLLFDPWEVLRLAGSDVGETSDEADIRCAYLRLSLLVHPDKLRTVEEATEAFQRLQWAYEAAVHPHDGMCVCLFASCRTHEKLSVTSLQCSSFCFLFRNRRN